MTNPQSLPNADDLFRAAENLHATAAKFNDLQARMNAISVTEVSADKRVSVTVDSNGGTTAIDLAPSTRGTDPRELSASIMACTRRAQAKLRGRVTDLVQETVGSDGPGAAIIDQYAERFPEFEPESPPPAHVEAPSQVVPPAPPVAASPPPSFPPPAGSGAAVVSIPRTRKPDREQVVIPDEPSEEDAYYRRGSWLV